MEFMEHYFSGFDFDGKEAMKAACKALESIYNINVAKTFELVIKRNIDDSPVFMRAMHDMLLNEACKQKDSSYQMALFNAAAACAIHARC